MNLISKASNKMSLIELFPSEVLVEVFRFLTSPGDLEKFIQLSFVNRRFSVLLFQERIWKEIFINFFFGVDSEHKRIGIECTRDWFPKSWFAVCKRRLQLWAHRRDRDADYRRLDSQQKKLKKLKGKIEQPIKKNGKGQLKGMLEYEQNRRLTAHVNMEDSRVTQVIKRVMRRPASRKFEEPVDLALGQRWASYPLNLIEGDCEFGLGLTKEEEDEGERLLFEKGLKMKFKCPITAQNGYKFLHAPYGSRIYWNAAEGTVKPEKSKLLCEICVKNVSVVSDIEELKALTSMNGKWNPEANQIENNCSRLLYVPKRERQGLPSMPLEVLTGLMGPL